MALIEIAALEREREQTSGGTWLDHHLRIGAAGSVHSSIQDIQEPKTVQFAVHVLKNQHVAHLWLFKRTLTRVRCEGRLSRQMDEVYISWFSISDFFTLNPHSQKIFIWENLRWLFLFYSERCFESSFMPWTSQFLFSFQTSQQFCRCTVVIVIGNSYDAWRFGKDDRKCRETVTQ